MIIYSGFQFTKTKVECVCQSAEITISHRWCNVKQNKPTSD